MIEAKRRKEPVKLATVALPLSTLRWIEGIHLARRDASMAATLRFLIEAGRAPAEEWVRHSPIAAQGGEAR